MNGERGNFATVVNAAVPIISGAALSGVVYLIFAVSHLADLERRVDWLEKQVNVDTQDVLTIKNSYITPQQHEALRTVIDGLKQDLTVISQRQLQVLSRLDHVDQATHDFDKSQADQDQRLRGLESLLGAQMKGP